MIEVLQFPVTIDIGGTDHHGNWHNEYGEGTLVCVSPDFTGYRSEGNVIYMQGGLEGVPLPPDTADQIHLTMVLFAICFAGTEPGPVVMRTVETAKAFAKPGATLEVLDMAYTVESAAQFLEGRGIKTQRRDLDWGKEKDRALCNKRSAHAIQHHEVGLALMTIPLGAA